MKGKQSQETLDQIERVTIGHYDASAEGFWLGTRDHDVSQNVAALLGVLPDDRPLDILDFGCGPGRDLQTFKQLGHRPTGLDGSAEFCEMARRHSGCAVLHQQFLSLDIGTKQYDGIFANASLFHVPSQAWPQVLTDCHAALKSAGVLFISVPRGDAEGWQGNRYGTYLELEQIQPLLEQAGFAVLNHYYRPPGQPRYQQPWLAIVSRR